jgi:hypothetical protein
MQSIKTTAKKLPPRSKYIPSARHPEGQTFVCLSDIKTQIQNQLFSVFLAPRDGKIGEQHGTKWICKC